VNLAELPDLIRTGRLDLFLTLPVDAQFAVSTRRFGMDNVVNAMVGVAIVVFSLFKLGIAPAASHIVLYGIAIGFGVTVHYAVMFFLATIAFWIVRAQGLIYGYYNVFNIARYPDVVFRGIFRVIFSYLIPVIIVANVPTRTLVRAFDSPWPGLAHLAGASIFVLVATRAFWHFALRRYSSASS
jgi:ABC-2 type transport system permease protein